VELELSAPQTWRLSQLIEWLTVNFMLNPKTFSVNVHALWSNSSTNIFWQIKPMEQIVGELVKRLQMQGNSPHHLNASQAEGGHFT
jgi:hypothetical protein